MFENLIKALEDLGEVSVVSVPILADAEGYGDHECPAEHCLFAFKIHGDDWLNIANDEEVFCPSCRHTAPATSWYTREQVEKAQDYALASFEGQIDEALRKDAREFNRKQSPGSLVSITLNVEGGSAPLLMPVAAAEPMRLRATCDHCGCRYSYIGAAFFCPACGTNSADHTFKQTLSTIRTAVQSGAVIRESLDRDAAAMLMTSLVEKGVQDAVMCFQRLCEQLYETTGAPAPRRNVFQNLADGSGLWERQCEAGYEGLVDAAEMGRLRKYFQQRHLLAHRNGLVDQEYVDRSGDSSYAVGQRLVVREEHVLDFVGLVEKLGLALKERVSPPR